MTTHRQNSPSRISVAIPLHSITSRIAVAIALILMGATLIYSTATHFIVSTLTDERATVNRATLTAAAALLPESARLQSRLALSAGAERDFADAEQHARRALELSPYNYNIRLLMASVKESRGDFAAAEEQLRQAVLLAPNKTTSHWQLANLLLRAGRRDDSLAEFRAASAMNPHLLPVTMNILWRATNENLPAVEAAVAGDAKSRLALAAFLLKQSHPQDAARIFRATDYAARRSLAESQNFISAMATVDAALARDLWVEWVGNNNGESPLLWNGSFETETAKAFGQYDWEFDRSEYARIRVLNGTAHNGNRALRVDFLGRDTTRLANEIRQTVVLRPNARYRLTCYARAENLVTSEGPRIAVTSKSLPNWIAQSEPLSTAQAGWQQLTVDFVAPSLPTGAQPAFEVTVRRKPKFSYDEPTTGTVWFDDFALAEVKP